MGIAQKWEVRTFEESQNKEQYVERMEQKLNEIRQRRSQHAGNIPLGVAGAMPNGQMPNNGMMRQGNMMAGLPNMGNMSNMQNMGNNMNGMNGMSGLGFSNNPMNGQNGLFPAQLARQMQPSPVNMPGQAGTLDPSALQISRQQSQQQQQQQQQQQVQQQQQNAINQAGPQQQASNMAQGGQAQSGPNMQAMITGRARQMYDQISEDQKRNMRQKLVSQMSEQQLQMMQQSRRDPVMQFCIKRAQEQFAKIQGQRIQQNPGVPANGNMNTQMGNNAPQQRPPSQAGGQNFDVSGILGQQANALKLQDAGEQVVPASNNNSNSFNMGLGNNQSINPQMLNNQGSAGGQSNNNSIGQQQATFYSQQRNPQQQDRLQKQMLAQQHAMQAARMQQGPLTGQPGGLHAQNAFNGGAAPSPAMSMLNRPMVPPGQITPGTPQPNRQQPMPQTPMNGANQLMQHHQNMVNQNNQLHNHQTQQMIPQNAIHSLLQRVPPEYRARLTSMPPEQMQAMLARLANANKLPSGLGQPGPMNPPGMPMQGGQQQSNMLQQQMGNAMPGFNSQLPPDHPNMQMNQPNTMQRQQPTQQTQQMAHMRQQILDSKPFPRSVLSALSISVPPQVQKWIDLKQHIAQNASVVPPQTQEKLRHLQQQWYQSHPQEVNTAMHSLLYQKRAQEQGQNNQQSMLVNNMQQPGMTGGSQAPPAQMVPPAPMMQAPQPNATPGSNPTQQQALHANILRSISPEDMQKWRMQAGQRAQGLTDDQVRQVMASYRLERLRQAQMQQGQRPPGQNPQIPRPPQANMPNGAQPQQRMPQPGQHQATVGQKPSQQANDDVIEISNPAMQQQAPQAPPMQASHSQQRMPTQEQIAQLTPEQKAAWTQKRQQIEALRRAQGGVNATGNPSTGMPANGSEAQQNLGQKLGAIMREIQSSTRKGPPVNLDAEGRERVRSSLARLWKPVMTMQQTFLAAMTWGMEQQIKDIARTKMIVAQNCKDEHGTVNEFYSVTLQQLQEMERTVATYMNDFKSMQMRMQAQKGAAIKDQQPAAPAMAPAASQQGHSRKASNIKAPPAPTDEKKFDWAAQSPGVPMYAHEQPGLTQDKLKFPPQKKRKPNQPGSQVSTPAAQTGTPATAGASPAIASGKAQQSPEQTRKTQQQLKAEADREAEAKRFRCKDLACEYSLHGFDTEAQLEDHDKAEHQPIEDPLAFFLANATMALDVDDQGNAGLKATVSDAKGTSVAIPPTKPRFSVKAASPKEATKAGEDARNKTTVPTPSQQKPGKKQTEADVHSDKVKEIEEEETMQATMTKKLNLPVLPVEPSVPGAEMHEDDDVDMFDFGLSGDGPDGMDLFGMDSNQMSFESIEEMARMGAAWEPVEGDLSSWRLSDAPELTDSSPERTPSDGSQSSHASDVSQSDTMRFIISCENDAWDAFGTGECGIAASMMPMYTQIKDMMGSQEGDVKDASSPRKRKAVEEAWDAPVRDFLENDFFGSHNQAGSN